MTRCFIAFAVLTGFASALLLTLLGNPLVPSSDTPADRGTPVAFQSGLTSGLGQSTDNRSWAETTLESLTVEEKVSQLFMVWMGGSFTGMDDPGYLEMQELVRTFGIGGFIFSTGDPLSQAATINDLQSQSDIPLLIGQDMEWGAAMRVRGSTMFPRAMALGATRNADHAYQKGYVTAREARAIGTHMVFAPVADVNNNPDNPVINTRSFGEDVDLVTTMSTAFARGVRDAGALATGKHFPGHGDTDVDSHFGLPVIDHDLARLDSLELRPFRALVEDDIAGLMTAHIAFPALEQDEQLPATLSPAILSGLLREGMGYDGLIVTDALRMDAIRDHFGAGEAAVRALEAGSDILLMPEDPWAARAGVMRALESGRISEGRLDESVLRILKAKEEMGLQQNRLVDLAGVRERVHSSQSEAAARVTAREALTLVHDDHHLIPFDSDVDHIVSIGITDNENSAAGRNFASELRSALRSTRVQHFSIDSRSTSRDRERALSAARRAEVVVLPTYVASQPGLREAGLPSEIRTFIDRLILDGPPSVLISLGTPYMPRGLNRQPSAYLLTYSGSRASERAAAHALAGQAAITGRLPVTIPGNASAGTGLQRSQKHPRAALPEEVGMRSRHLAGVDSLINRGILNSTFPGAAVAVGRGTSTVHEKAYGFHTYEAEARVDNSTPYDLASLTKVLVTTTAIMQLVEAGDVELSAPVAHYLPEFGRAGKDSVTVEQLLTHTSGLPSHRKYFEQGLRSSDQVIDAVFSEELVTPPGTSYEYSDLGFIVLGALIEDVSGQSLDDYAEQHIFEPLGMTDTGYRGTGRPDTSVAPTEHDLAFRQRLLQGEVHDENAWVMGGVAGHAGVFSTIRDMARFGYMLVNDGRINGKQFLQPETIRMFIQAVSPDEHSRARGWDTRSPEGYSSAGQYFSDKSYGHTGFTGTSIWVDPEEELYVVLLSNRVHPTRENRGHTQVRPELADIVHRSIAGPPAPLQFGR